jgi:hypothetical protein
MIQSLEETIDGIVSFQSLGFLADAGFVRYRQVRKRTFQRGMVLPKRQFDLTAIINAHLRSNVSDLGQLELLIAPVKDSPNLLVVHKNQLFGINMEFGMAIPTLIETQSYIQCVACGYTRPDKLGIIQVT